MLAFPRPLPEAQYLSYSLELQRFVSSSQSGGRLTNIVEYADPLWRATAELRPLRANSLRVVEAWWNSLRGGMHPVLARSPRYCAPAAHTRSRGPETVVGQLAAINEDGSVSVSGVSPSLVLQSGDFVSFSSASGRALGLVVDCEGVGISRAIMIEPRLPRNYPVGAAVHFDRAELLMRPVPDSFSKGEGPLHAVSFQLMESRA